MPALKSRPVTARLAFLADRTVVLFMGVAVGAAIALAFVGGGRIDLGALRARPASAPAPQHPPSTTGGRPPAAAVDCAIPFPARLVARLHAGQPVTIGVFGDSFGDGFWAALYRRLAKDNVKVLRLSQEGVGFTRYQTIDLQRKALEDVKSDPVDIAVVVIGANDTQGLFDDAHEHAYPLMSPMWQAIYGGRIDRFVGLMRSQGAMVYWVGLPKMRQPAYDRDVAALDDFFAARMAALNVPYLSTRELSVDRNGEFNAYLADGAGGAPRLMRANDGVHMTIAGYERLASPLVDRIRIYLARAARPAEATGPV